MFIKPRLFYLCCSKLRQKLVFCNICNILIIDMETRYKKKTKYYLCTAQVDCVRIVNRYLKYFVCNIISWEKTITKLEVNQGQPQISGALATRQHTYSVSWAPRATLSHDGPWDGLNPAMHVLWTVSLKHREKHNGNVGACSHSSSRTLNPNYLLLYRIPDV